MSAGGGYKNCKKMEFLFSFDRLDALYLNKMLKFGEFAGMDLLAFWLFCGII